MYKTSLFVCRLLKRKPVSPWKELLDSLESNPQEWVSDGFTLTNKRNKAEFWIANGYYFLKMYPGELAIPISQRYRIYKAVNEIQAALFKSKE
jgi:hypothetical protein|nr:MAG TPA: hypothetical protein [Caudoviricetes sp.]